MGCGVRGRLDLDQADDIWLSKILILVVCFRHSSSFSEAEYYRNLLFLCSWIEADF